MAKQLIEAMSAPFDPKKFKDSYRDKVKDLVHKKARGEEIVDRGGARAARRGGRPDGGPEGQPGTRRQRKERTGQLAGAQPQGRATKDPRGQPKRPVTTALFGAGREAIAPVTQNLHTRPHSDRGQRGAVPT